MKFKRTEVARETLSLANDHYVAVPYDCSEIDAEETSVIPAGTIIPANDATAVGVLLTDVVPEENPNGTIIIHGFIDKAKLPTAPEETAITALKGITFLPLTDS